jgi:transcriptional regulator with XRE-family HTH domain
MRLTNERKRRGWTRAELARRANMNATTVSLIETGRLRPYPGQLAKLAHALGVAEEQAHALLGDATDLGGDR